jgi:hypothetical protein
VTGVAGETQPYLSIVATTRNDDHGGDALARTQIFLDALAAQCERHGLDAELVLVEWNPPPDRPGLRDALRWPAPGKHFEARIIEVPADIHARLAHSERLPLFQMIAKNVGIRRARGQFALATNIDLIFSDELVRFLAERRLDPRLVYRVDRYDVDVGIPDVSIDEQLEWCEQHLLRVNRRDGTYEFGNDHLYRIYDMRFPLWLASWLRIVGHVGRTVFGAATFPVRAPLRVARGTSSAQEQLHNAKRVALSLPRLVRSAWFEERALMRMHTNACGDFTLLSREGWDATGGYPELELYSFFIDALFMYEAHYAGFREALLPYPMYHMEHGGGWKPDEEGLKALVDGLERRGIPMISYQQFLDWVIQMYRAKQGVFDTHETWGYSDEALREQVVIERRRDPGLARAAS